MDDRTNDWMSHSANTYTCTVKQIVPEAVSNSKLTANPQSTAHKPQGTPQQTHEPRDLATSRDVSPTTKVTFLPCGW